MEQKYSQLLQAGPGKASLLGKIIAGAGVVGAGLASSHWRTRPSAQQMEQIQTGVYNATHPGQPGYGPGNYSQQLARLQAGAKQEQSQQELGMRAQTLGLEQKRLDEEAAYRRALLGERQSLAQVNATSKGVFSDSDANPDPEKFQPSPTVMPDWSAGGAPRRFWAYKPEYLATMRATASTQAKDVPMTEEDAKSFGIPTAALRRNSLGQIMVPNSVALEAVRQKLSPGNLTVDRQSMQTIIDKYARGEGKAQGLRVEDLNPEDQLAATREVLMLKPGLTAEATGRTPSLVQAGLQARIAQTRTQTAATAQGAFLPPAAEPGAPAPPAPGAALTPPRTTHSKGRSRPSGPAIGNGSGAPATPPSGAGIPNNLVRTTASGRSYIDGTALDARGKSAMIQRAPQGTPVFDQQDVQTVRSIDMTRHNNEAMIQQIQAKLPRDASGRILGGPMNKLSSIFQTDNDLAAFKTWRESAFNQIKALGGASGGRISNERINIALQNLPLITDTVGTAQQKLSNIDKMLDDTEGAMWPGESANRGSGSRPPGIPAGARVQFSKSRNQYRYSTDGGKTWQIAQ